MYVRDVARKEFYEALGLDAREYDRMVIDKTNETSARVFPVVLDVKNPKFWDGSRTWLTTTQPSLLLTPAESPAPVKLIRKLPHFAANALQMASLFFMAPVRSENYQPAVR